jgi:hypothetical protein
LLTGEGWSYLRVSKQVKSRFSRRRRRSPPDSSGLPGARAAA